MILEKFSRGKVPVNSPYKEGKKALALEAHSVNFYDCIYKVLR
jgi:hypothetical protein